VVLPVSIMLAPAMLALSFAQVWLVLLRSDASVAATEARQVVISS
jgi:hypothetical protein